MTTPNGQPSQGISHGPAGSAVEDARRQAAASGGAVHTDQDTPLASADSVTAQRNRIESQTGGNAPAAGPTVTR